MFLRSLLRTNPQFVSSAIELHQSGKIPANSYVLDIDTIAENAKHIVAEARKHRLTIFPMTKQFGRTPMRSMRSSRLALMVLSRLT